MKGVIMHMADALLSPAVGGAMWAATAGTIAYCSTKVRKELDDSKVPLMGVLGAFLFAAQMINFTIPATGSSGHLGGGLLLTVLLGPHAAFLVISSVLLVQALFFADGGLLALGCNIFNLGVFPAFIAYPFIYKIIAGDQTNRSRVSIAAMVAAVAGLQLGAFGVVMETTLSGISSLPFSTFVLLMQPIHLGIGVVEGLVTAAVISFVYKARPEIISCAIKARASVSRPMRTVVLAFAIAAVLTGGVLSWFASEKPDGLEWSIKKLSGKEELNTPENGFHAAMSALQKNLAFLPDYSFKKPEAAIAKEGELKMAATVKPGLAGSKEVGNKMGTSVSGILGGLITLASAFAVGYALKRRAGTT